MKSQNAKVRRHSLTRSSTPPPPRGRGRRCSFTLAPTCLNSVRAPRSPPSAAAVWQWHNPSPRRWQLRCAAVHPRQLPSRENKQCPAPRRDAPRLRQTPRAPSIRGKGNAGEGGGGDVSGWRRRTSRRAPPVMLRRSSLEIVLLRKRLKTLSGAEEIRGSHIFNEAGSAKNRPRGGSAGACSESPARGTGAVYGAYNAPCESVAGGGDGAFVAVAPLCAHPRTSIAVSIPDAGVGNHVLFVS